MMRLRERIQALLHSLHADERGSLPFAILVSAVVLTISAIVGTSIAWQAKSVFKEQSTQEAAWATSSAVSLGLEALSVIDPKTDPALTGIPSTLSTTDIPAGVTWTKTDTDGPLLRWWIIRGPNPLKITLQAQGKAGDVIPAQKMITAQVEYDPNNASWQVMSIKDITTGDFRDPLSLTPGVINGVNLYLDAAKKQSYPGSGTSWYDLSNNNNTATLVNGPSYSASIGGGSIIFDGTNDYATIPSIPASFWNGSSWTVSTWVQLDTVNRGVHNTLLSHGVNGTNTALFIQERAGKPFFGFYGNDITGTTALQPGTWYNLVFTYNYGTKAKSIYVNGILDTTGGTVGYSGTGTNTRLGIGTVLANDYLDGNMANITLYSKALSPYEIQAGYTANKKKFGYGPVLDFNMSQESYPGTGTTWFDTSGNGNNITLTNGPKYSQNNGGYLQFDGVNDYGITASNVSFGNNTTWEAWINATSKPGVYNVFMGRGLPYFGMYNGNSFIFSNTISSVQQTYTSPANLSLGTWYHAVFTTAYDGTNTVEKTYVNGVQVATATYPGVQVNTATKFAVGTDISQTNPFAGKISTVRAYNYTMQAAEILQLYTSSKSVYSTANTGPVLLYDTASTQSYSGTGTTWFDLTPNDNDGTLVNGPTFSTSNGTSMNFDGTNDYVSIPTLDQSLWANSSWTVNTWVKFNGVNRGVHNTILSHGVNGTNTALFIQERAGKPFFGFYGNDITGTTALQPGTWYNLTFTYDNTTKAKSIYVNGKLDTTGGTVGYSGTGTNTRIGIGTVLVNDYLSGKIGAIAISDRALGAAEIATSYNSSKLRYEGTTSTTPIFTVAADNSKSYSSGENMLYQSDNISTSPWVKIGANLTLTADTAVAPDGTTTADSLTDSGWAGGDSFYQDVAVSGTGTYTLSTYVKKGTSSTIIMAGYFMGNTTVENKFVYNTATGTITTGPGENLATVTDEGDGWYRISMTITGGNALNTTLRWQIYANSGGTTYFWGPQLERSPAVDAPGYLSLSGASGNYASTPDNNKLDITGDITIASQVAFFDWTPAASASRIVGKRGGSTGGYEFFLRSAGVLEFQWYDSVTAGYRSMQSSVATGIPDGTAKWVAATLDADNGAGGFTVRFWTSNDGKTWTQLGSDRTATLTATMTADTSAVEVGARGGTNDAAKAEFYRATIANGIGAGGVPGGATALDIDFTALPAGTTTFTASTGQAITVNTSGSPGSSILPRAPILPVYGSPNSTIDGFVYTPGAVGNSIQVGDSNEFDITGDIDLRVKVAPDDWTPATYSTLVSKWSGTNNRSYLFWLRSDGVLEYRWAPDGTSGTETVKSSNAVVGAVDGTVKWLRVTHDVDNGASGNDVKFWTSNDGITWVQLGSTITTALATKLYSGTSPLYFGDLPNQFPFAGKFYRVTIKDGISGPTVYDADMTNLPTVGTTTFNVNGATINYAENPSFETNTSYWGGAYSTLSTTSSGGVVGGTKALQILPNSATNDSYAYLTASIAPFKAGKTYTVSGTITIPVAQTGTTSWARNQIWVGPYVGAAIVGAASSPIVTGPGSARVSATFTVPAGMTSLSLRLYNGYSNSATNVVYWDNIQIEEAATASTYFDGSTAGAIWAGTANNSASYLTTIRTATINKSGTAATSNVGIKTQPLTGLGATTFTPTTTAQVLRGNTWTNTAATGNNATLTSGPVYNPANTGGININGFTNKIDMPTWPNLGLSNTFSISYWATVNTNPGTWWAPAFASETYLTNGFRHGYGMNANRNLRFWANQSGGTLDVTTGNNVYPLGVPFFVTLTYDGTKGTIYVNGVQQGQATGTLITPSTALTYGTGGGWDGTNRGAISSLHSAEIYDRVLTPTEITLMYRGKKDLYNPNLVVNASFEDSLTSGATFWQGGGCSGTTIVINKGEVPAAVGSSVLKGTALAACNSRAYYYHTPSAPYGIPVVPGQTYTVTASTRAATTPRTFDLPMDFYDASGVYVGGTDPADVLNKVGEWTTASDTFTVPLGVVAVIPSMRWISVNTGEVHYLDNYTFTKN